MKQLRLEWEVPELSKDNPGSGQTAGQLFEGRAAVPVELFVREDLQNRVDARLEETEPAQVFIRRYSLPKRMIDELFTERFKDRLRRTSVVDLPEKEAAKRVQRLERLFASDELPVLAIEDFGTTGLNGPINMRHPEKRPGEPLYHPTNALMTFLRRNGRSGKSDKALGSAGLGRHVYYKASEISAKLVYTVPSDLSERVGGSLRKIPSTPLFFGQSFQRELEETDADGTERSYICYHHLTSPKGKNGYPMPFGVDPEEKAGVERLRKDLRLRRENGETGCSIVIPFPRKELTEERLVIAVCAEFALPILRGQLIVSTDQVKVTHANVDELSGDTNVDETNSFLKAALAADDDVVSATVSPERLGGAIDQELFGADQLAAMAADWKEFQPVFVDFRLPVDDEGATGQIRVGVQRCAGGVRGRGIVARGGLCINAHSGKRNTKSWNGCVLVGADALGDMLRRCETPAHDKWLPSELEDSGCADPTALVHFVTNAHAGLNVMLEGLDVEDDTSIFAELLPDPRRQGRAGPGSKGGTKTKRRFDVALRADGQSIAITPFEKLPPKSGSEWLVEVVFDSVLGGGRARKSYRPGTFDLSAAPFEVRSGEILERSECSFRLRVDDPDEFEVVVGPCGFAEWADVRVHVEEESK